MTTTITESASPFNHLEKMTTKELLEHINEQDALVPVAVKKVIPQIQALVEAAFVKIVAGGHLFYLGAGTSGRLAIVDAAECPPTYGVSPDTVIAIIAGGDKAIRSAVEFAEDDPKQAWQDLKKSDFSATDCVIGLSASGKTPYVVGGVKKARQIGALTACITCNPDTVLAKTAHFPIEVIVGPEFVTGSTRMKAGTAEKLILNMISTALMIKLGKVKGSKMVDMQLSNKKLVQRGIKMLMDELGVDEKTAKQLLQRYGSVRNALNNYE